MSLIRLAILFGLALLAFATEFVNAQEVNVVGQRLKTMVGVNGDGSGEVKVEPGALREAIRARRANVVDPGSLKTVNYQQWDTAGVLWHYTGTQWTSYGEYRSDITRTAISRRAVTPVYSTQPRSRAVTTTRSTAVATTTRTSATVAAAAKVSTPAPAPKATPAASGRGVHVRW